MTDRLAALRALLHHPVCDDSVTDALTDFYEQFQADPLVIDKWFTLQATAPGMSVDGIRGLMAHPSFDRRNPNRYRALVFQFCMNNPGGFHAQSGQGYALWAQEVCQLDAANPELAARLARVMDHWTHHQPALREGMQAALRTVAAHENLSNNTREIVTKALSL
jgi:aminopeptidase N